MNAPPPDDPARQRRTSRVLVAAQFALMAVLAAAAAWRAGSLPAGAWALLLAGAAVGAWAVSANRPGNFNIRPDPRPGGVLVEHGPYRWIRHPMYTAVLALGAACAWASGALWAWAVFALLAGVLAVKAAVEERLLLAAHPGYAAYRARTRRFLPGVF